MTVYLYRLCRVARTNLFVRVNLRLQGISNQVFLPLDGEARWGEEKSDHTPLPSKGGECLVAVRLNLSRLL